MQWVHPHSCRLGRETSLTAFTATQSYTVKQATYGSSGISTGQPNVKAPHSGFVSLLHEEIL